MLIGQAALAFELFFGAAPPRDRDDELRALADGMTSRSASPARSAWASRPSRRCSPTMGVPVFDADAAVHRLQGPGGALVAAIEARFPGTTGAGGRRPRDARRARCSAIRAALRALEAIVHPAVGEARARVSAPPCRRAAGRARRAAAVRNRRRARCRQGRRRLRARRGAARARACPARHDRRRRFDAILARQMPDAEKRARADFVIPTGGRSTETRAAGARADRLPRGRAGTDNAGMREIVFDTETTGLSFAERRPAGRDRLRRTDQPGRDRAHLPRLFQSRTRRCRPRRRRSTACATPSWPTSRCSRDGVDDLLDFLGDAPLVAHNAAFDFGFLNGELQRCGRADRRHGRGWSTRSRSRARCIPAPSTASMRCARATASIAATASLHGALLDAQLLAQVYVELTGGRQIGLGLVSDVAEDADRVAPARGRRAIVRPPRIFAASEAELAAPRRVSEGDRAIRSGGPRRPVDADAGAGLAGRALIDDGE